MADSPTGTILLVDGEEDRSQLSRMLTRAGFQVSEACTGQDALRSMAARPDLVILSVRLPDGPGIDVCRRIKSEPGSASIPVLLLAPRTTSESDRSRGIEAGAAGFIPWPIDAPELLATVKPLVQIRQAEETAWSVARQWRMTFDAIRDGVCLLDQEGKVFRCNWSMASMLDRPFPAIVGGRFADLALTRLGRIPLALLEEVHRTRQRQSRDFPIQDRWFRLTADPVLGEREQITENVLVLSDITEQRQAEESLRRQAQIIDQIHDAVISTDLNGIIASWNGGAERLYGYQADEVVGRPVSVLYADPEADLAPEQIMPRLQARGSDEHEVRMRRKSGEVFYVHLSLSMFRGSEGVATGLIGYSMDITERKRAEQFEAKLSLAREIQQHLFPTKPPRFEGIDVGGTSYPADATGGDYFDFFLLSGGSLGITIGDVSGHGFGPALLMAEIRAYLRALALTCADVSQILGLLNHALVSDLLQDHFVTLLLARLDPRTRSFRFASAGHPNGYVLDAAGKVRMTLESTGLPIGILADADFPTCGPLTLEPGDLVLFLTDGIVEAHAPDDATFGTERALQVVHAHRHQSARAIVDHLYRAVRAFVQGKPQDDDITAVVLKVE